MHAFSLTSLILLLSVVRSLEAVSLVSRSGSRVLPARSDGSDSPRVIDATDGELEITNKEIAPDGFSRRLVRLYFDVSLFNTRPQCYFGWWYLSWSNHQGAKGWSLTSLLVG